MNFEITSMYAAQLALFYVLLSVLVIRARLVHKVGLGDKNNPALLKVIRIHGNFAEYVPLLLVLMALVEASALENWKVHLLGALMLTGRVLHCIGLLKTATTSRARLLGMVCTFAALIASALFLLVR